MIPKVIHYCWFGGNPLPEKDKEKLESWKKFCPDYQIIEWNESNYDYTKNQYMREAYAEKKYAFLSDYARLDIVYNHGGIYLDTDVLMLKNIDEFLAEKAFCGYETSEFIGLGLVFGAEKHTPIIKELMDYYEDKSFYFPDGRINNTPITFYTNAVLAPKGLRRDNTKQTIEGLTVYPTRYFNPRGYFGEHYGNIEDAYTFHDYNSSWVSDGRVAYRDKVRYLVEKYGEEATFSGRADKFEIFSQEYNDVKKRKGRFYAFIWKLFHSPEK